VLNGVVIRTAGAKFRSSQFSRGMSKGVLGIHRDFLMVSDGEDKLPQKLYYHDN